MLVVDRGRPYLDRLPDSRPAGQSELVCAGRSLSRHRHIRPVWNLPPVSVVPSPSVLGASEAGFSKDGGTRRLGAKIWKYRIGSLRWVVRRLEGIQGRAHLTGRVATENRTAADETQFCAARRPSG